MNHPFAPPDLTRCLGLAVCLLCAAGAQAQPEAPSGAPPDSTALPDSGARSSTPLRAGYLAHTAGDGTQVLYFFGITADGALSLREGRADTAPTVTVPGIIARTAVEQLNAVAPRDAARTERLDVDLRGKTLWVRWARGMNVFWVLAVGGLLGGSVMGAGVWLWLRRERAERRRLAESRAHLAAGQEAERNRLAHELHDGPLQDLHGIRMRLGARRQTVHADAPDDLENDLLEDDLVTVVAELRAIMADLHPPALTPFGLSAAVRAHLDRFRRRYPQLTCRFEGDDERIRLSPDARLALFRVCQEALSNAARHAHAHRVEVTLGVEGDRAVLRVSDDGRGFTETERRAFPERGSFGLSNMTARAEAVGASLRITSAPGQGTTIEVAAPLSGEAPPPSRDGRRGHLDRIPRAEAT